MTLKEALDRAMQQEQFRYWSARATAETLAAINASCPAAAAAHDRLAALCIRQALACIGEALLAFDNQAMQQWAA